MLPIVVQAIRVVVELDRAPTHAVVDADIKAATHRAPKLLPKI